jgi:hypothetical protein
MHFDSVLVYFILTIHACRRSRILAAQAAAQHRRAVRVTGGPSPFLRNVGIPRNPPPMAMAPTIPTIRLVSNEDDGLEEEMREYNFQTERANERDVGRGAGEEAKQRQDSGHSM